MSSPDSNDLPTAIGTLKSKENPNIYNKLYFVFGWER